MGLFLKGGKTAQLRSKTASSNKTASSSTTLFLWSLRGHYAVTTRSLRSLRGHYGHYAVTTRSLRGHYAVTTRSLRGHYAVTTRSLRGHYAVTTRSLYGHYAVTTVTTRSLRSLRGHYAGSTRSERATRSRLRKRSTSLQNGLFDQDIVAADLEGSDFIKCFKFDSLYRKSVSSLIQ